MAEEYPEFAVGRNGKVDLWCENQGGGKGWVINGAWDYPSQHTGKDIGEIVWRGKVPAPFNVDYNDAIRWIESELANTPN
jgi:hypothetical protein